MSTQHPHVPTNLEQQHKLAKDLLRDARYGEPEARARLAAVRADIGVSRPPQLADAQFAIAREAGFDSWPALVDELRKRDVAAFLDGVCRGDVTLVERLLGLSHVKPLVNAALFDFGKRAAHMAANNPPLLDVLLAAGTDLSLKSHWENGPYTVLDLADEPNARRLLLHGATLTPNAAARLGWIDELRRLLATDSSLVYARGGDGQQPLHEAATVAIADLLLQHGADPNARCIDHQSTSAQYALAERPEICRRLLERGATPDIFMPARLGDVALATRVLDADPHAIAARINEPGYAPVPPLHIYCWTLGFGLSPHDVALKFGHRDVYDLLVARSPDTVRFLEAIEAGDEAAAVAVTHAHPALVSGLPPHVHAHLAFAIFHSRFAVADLMLRIGFDPAAPGTDGGSALHAACWVGHVGLVDRILARETVPIDSRDETHGSTPLGWAAFGSVHRRASGADYSAVIDRLVAAGADVHAPGNRKAMSLIAMARGNAAVQATLREHGATE